jgi:hypothetical protein
VVLELREIKKKISDFLIDQKFSSEFEFLIECFYEIENNGVYVFYFEINGNYKWNMSVYPDMCIFFEHIDYIIRFAKKEISEFTIDFYEQGREFCVRFESVENKMVKIYFESYYAEGFIADIIQFEEFVIIIKKFIEEVIRVIYDFTGCNNEYVRRWVDMINP